MAESSDDIIVLSDDEEDVKIESVVTSKRPKPIEKSRPVRTNTSTKSPVKSYAPILVLTEPKSISYGIERGYKVKHIHGVTRVKPENDLVYLVEYDLCDDYEFVPASILRQYCDENILIQYLENLTQFTN